MKKVLIITYYWPPSGGSGVQRWLKFVKYLPQFGWKPYVFTPENPSFEIRDDGLQKDVPVEAEIVRTPIWEPYSLFRSVARLSGKKSVKHTDMVTAGEKSFFQKTTSWIRGNLFIPDARIFWVKPSVAFLQDFIQTNDIQTIITTGPPHSMHLIGLKLKEKNKSLKWIADFRDPWSEWDLLDTFSLTSWARKRHQRLEKKVLQKADEILTIAPFHVARFEQLGGREVKLLTNGFDEDDFRAIQKIRTDKFTIRHIGMVDELRDPRPFMDAVKQLARSSADFYKNLKIEFIGSVNSSFRNFVETDPILSEVTVFTNPMPHAALVKVYGETDCQLLVLAHTGLAAGNLPGKFFEYLASGNFILGVGPEEGDAADVLNKTHAGVMIERENAEKIKAVLKERFDHWQAGFNDDKRDVSMFSRRMIAEELASLLR